MALGEAESGLFGLFTNQSVNVFEPMSAGFECLGAGGIQDGSGVLLNQVAESHNRAQRLRAACVESTLCPLAALLAQDRRSVDPIAARRQHRSAEAAGSQGVAKLAGFRPTTKRLEAGGTMRADFLMCGIGSDARGFLHNKRAVVSEALVPFGQARPFQGGCDRSGGVE